MRDKGTIKIRVPGRITGKKLSREDPLFFMNNLIPDIIKDTAETREAIATIKNIESGL